MSVRVGSIGTSIPADAMIASVNSYHEQAPEAVRWTTPSAPASTASRMAAARSAVNVGCRRWSDDHAQRPLLARAGDHPLDEVAALAGAAVQPVEAGGADDQRPLAVGERGVLAGELGQRVDRARRRQVCLGVGLLASAVEHVVGRDVDEPRHAPRKLADGLDVHLPGAVRLALADVDVVKRGAVEHDVGLDLAEARSTASHR